MPKIKPKLTDTQIRNFKPEAKPYKRADEGGLVLLVRPTGTKVWQHPYKLAGKYNVFTIGQYPDVSAADAHERLKEIKKLIKAGIDPNLNKKATKQKNMGDNERSFEFIAREWLEKQSWVRKHALNICRRFESDVFPKIGSLQIDQIKPHDIIDLIKGIEDRGAEDVAKRTCQHVSAIFEYAIVKDICDYNPAMGRSKIVKKVAVKHRAHLKENQLPQFLYKLESYPGGKLVQSAMKLLMLTMVRPGELRNARWDEINEEKAEWRIPAERMKMRRDHFVPLSKQALKTLSELKSISGKGDLIFPGNRSPHIPISDVTLIKVLIILGYKGLATPHGMRATASTILNENGFNADAIERQLAHVEGNKVRAAYHHSEYLEERIKMMQWYADFLDNKCEIGRKENASLMEAA